jgi:hypothetical protein
MGVTRTFEVGTMLSPMKVAVFWVVAPCSLVDVYQRFRCPCCFHHQGTALQPRRQPSSYSPPWEPQILDTIAIRVLFLKMRVIGDILNLGTSVIITCRLSGTQSYDDHRVYLFTFLLYDYHIMMMMDILTVRELRSSGWYAGWWVKSCRATERERERHPSQKFDATIRSEKMSYLKIVLFCKRQFPAAVCFRNEQ